MTTQAKHTPGPWEVFPDNNNGLFTVGIKSHDYSGTEYGIIAENIDLEANANLIAAAPELLVALESAAFALESIINLQGRAELMPHLQQAQAAIAKAKGE